MKNQHNQKCFSIQIKISGVLTNLPVYENDTHQSLVRRFCQNHQLKKQYQNTIKDKIIQSLLKLTQQKRISAILKQKISKFVNQTKQTVTPLGSISIEKNRNCYSNSKTPYRLLQEQSICSKSIANRHKNNHCEENKQIKSKTIKNVTPKLDKNQKKHSLPNSCDPDLLRAYETILSKCKDSNMKQIAKKYLNQAKKHKDIVIGQFNPSELKQIKKSYRLEQKQQKQQKRDFVQHLNISKPNITAFQQRPLNINTNNLKRYNYDKSYATNYDVVNDHRNSRSYDRILGNLQDNNSLFLQYSQIPGRNKSTSCLPKTKKYQYLHD